MNVYITNVTKNIDVSIREKTLKPGRGDVFSEEASKQDGVVAFVKKGWLKIEMVKESPSDEGVMVAVVPEPSPIEADLKPVSIPVNDQPLGVTRADKKRKGG